MRYAVLSVLCIIVGNERILGQISGPYKVILSRMENCEDEGTGQIKFGTKISSKGNNIYMYTNNVTIQVPIDERLKYNIEFQELKNGVYVPRFLIVAFKNCEKIMKVMKPVVTDVLKAANYTFTGCPIPVGVYDVRDWIVNVEFNNIPSMFYLSYKMINTFYRDNKKVGCFIAYGDNVPKES